MPKILLDLKKKKNSNFDLSKTLESGRPILSGEQSLEVELGDRIEDARRRAKSLIRQHPIHYTENPIKLASQFIDFRSAEISKKIVQKVVNRKEIDHSRKKVGGLPQIVGRNRNLSV